MKLGLVFLGFMAGCGGRTLGGELYGDTPGDAGGRVVTPPPGGGGPFNPIDAGGSPSPSPTPGPTTTPPPTPAPTPAPPAVACGSSSCHAVTQECCIDLEDSALSCVPKGACPGPILSCTSSINCSGGLLCCATDNGAACQPRCDEGPQLCQDSSECRRGRCRMVEERVGICSGRGPRGEPGDGEGGGRPGR